MADFKKTFSIPRLDPDKTSCEDLDLIREMPLSVSVNGAVLTTAMRTPGLEKAQAAGFCLGEGVLTSREDLLGFMGDVSENSAHIFGSLLRKRPGKGPKIWRRNAPKACLSPLAQAT